MGTRSTIALEYADGTIGQIYCHWDGYLSHHGTILIGFYTDPFKVRTLLDSGDMSCLSETVESCEFYSQRGEHCPQRQYKNFAEYKSQAQMEEYNYILRRDGRWYVEFYGKFDGLLTEAWELQKKQNAEENAE